MLSRLLRRNDPSSAHDKGVARDAAMLTIFRQHGIDMERIRPTDHNFVAPSNDAAQALAARLAAHSETVTVNRVLRRWTVEAVVQMSLSETSVAAKRAEFEALAAETGTTYDGWGAVASDSA